MENSVDFTTIQTVLESNANKVENLIKSYVDKKEQIISLLQDVQAEFNYIPQDVLVLGPFWIVRQPLTQRLAEYAVAKPL